MTHPLEGAKTVRVSLPGPKSDWTPERIALMHKLWLEGKSGAQVAAELGGTTASAVIGKLHRLKLAARSLSADEARRPIRRRGTPKAPPRAPRAEPKPEVVRPLEHEVVSARPLTMLELPLRGACRWIVDTDDALSCGNPCGDNTYCPGHHRIAYERTAPKYDRSRIKWLLTGIERRRDRAEDMPVRKPWEYQVGRRA